eukprot:scaffold2201_cov110-Isochrysis_galbana.AAC.9
MGAAGAGHLAGAAGGEVTAGGRWLRKRAGLRRRHWRCRLRGTASAERPGDQTPVTPPSCTCREAQGESVHEERRQVAVGERAVEHLLPPEGKHGQQRRGQGQPHPCLHHRSIGSDSDGVIAHLVDQRARVVSVGGGVGQGRLYGRLPVSDQTAGAAGQQHRGGEGGERDGAQGRRDLEHQDGTPAYHEQAAQSGEGVRGHHLADGVGVGRQPAHQLARSSRVEEGGIRQHQRPKPTDSPARFSSCARAATKTACKTLSPNRASAALAGEYAAPPGPASPLMHESITAPITRGNSRLIDVEPTSSTSPPASRCRSGYMNSARSNSGDAFAPSAAVAGTSASELCPRPLERDVVAALPAAPRSSRLLVAGHAALALLLMHAPRASAASAGRRLRSQPVRFSMRPSREIHVFYLKQNLLVSPSSAQVESAAPHSRGSSRRESAKCDAAPSSSVREKNQVVSAKRGAKQGRTSCGLRASDQNKTRRSAVGEISIRVTCTCAAGASVHSPEQSTDSAPRTSTSFVCVYARACSILGPIVTSGSVCVGHVTVRRLLSPHYPERAAVLLDAPTAIEVVDGSEPPAVAPLARPCKAAGHIGRRMLGRRMPAVATVGRCRVPRSQ